MNDLSIPWTRVAAFIRQHTHDVRNTINCMDLEIELMSDVVVGEEAEESMRRIRGQLRSLELQMRSLSSAFHEPRPMTSPIGARVLLQIWREKHAEMENAAQIDWVNELGEEEVNVDVEMISAVFKELLANAVAFSPAGEPLTVTASAKDGKVVFELREPKKEALDPSLWGQPLATSARGRYGLGLWAAKKMAEANGASLAQRYDVPSHSLVTVVSMPA